MKEPGKDRIRVAASQYFIRPVQSFDQFADQVAAAVETAAGYHCRLLVLPEYFTLQLISLYPGKRPIQEHIEYVSEYRVRYVELMQQLAGENGLYIVAGTIPVRDDETGRIHNDAYLFAPSGNYGVQGKLHMTRFEHEDWGVSARSQIRIFETEFGKMAIAICYDVEFPELVRAVAHEGVHLLAVPSNTDDRYGYLRVRYCSHARAIENQLYVVCAHTVGSLPRVADISMNYGKASILTPSDFFFARDGILAEGVLNQEDMIIGEIDMQQIEQSRSFGTVLPLRDSKRSKELIADIDVVTL